MRPAKRVFMGGDVIMKKTTSVFMGGDVIMKKTTSVKNNILNRCMLQSYT